MEELTIQAFTKEEWLDVAIISFPKSDKKNLSVTELHYLDDYALDHHNKDDLHAVSINHPVSFFFDDMGKPGWLKFLDDIMPSGAGRRYWVKHLDIEDLTYDEQDYILLKFGTMSPVGNLRVKDSLPERHEVSDTLYFSVGDVLNRAGDFLDYAQQRGATAGGATGAGGEAPKLLLRCSIEEDASDNKIWIDPYQDDDTNQDLHYLVKYPRGSRTTIDCNILRAEFYYYHELTEMGFDTIPIENMRLEEGINYPSLWLPRFDIKFNDQQHIERFGMESVYSILGKGAGVTLDHEATIRALIEKITQSHMVSSQGYDFDIQDFVIEWVKRDLLNILFGNSDNHGRNTSFLKGDGFIKLAPIYDFAPMKADPEGIPRTTKWRTPLEVGGTYDFIGIADLLSDLVASEILLAELRSTAKQCLDLKKRLVDKGVPEQILEMPATGLNHISDKLTKWGLL
ncbi:HipA domain-containing protein [Vibrio sp. DW001]|uniref:type II toxin-antitoxin system HipA family toxin n=1 Tax=Vibrio sp. DW001 TaxID=2912315 RepID=UPI0023B09CAD|nr:HipA domain-containing protein [Vibrio sp. DW001]WED27293.1 HipA domain-containing protein [Vibrio sp. DW001]